MDTTFFQQGEEEKDYSCFYYSFQQLDSSTTTPTHIQNTHKHILTTLLLLDQQQQMDHEPNQKMDDYYTHFTHEHDTEVESDHLRIKRMRHEETGVVTTTCTGGNDQTGPAEVDQHHRRLWVKDRSKAWWNLCNSPDFPDSEFKKAFRMSKSTFDMICQQLDSAITKKDTMLRLAIPVRQRVAVCIWRLATGDPLRLVSRRFGLGISTCHKLVLEVCSALHSVLMPKFLNWPDQTKMFEIKNEFENLSGIPNVGGSMYTTQGVVDTKGVFTDVCIGWPGSMSDDKVLEKSALYRRANKGFLKDVLVVGNSGYGLRDWVLVPYTHHNLTCSQHSFNEKIEENQKIARQAFMRLKARWSSLQKRTEVKLQDLPVVVGAACVLHNICEMNNESLDPELRLDLFDDPMVAENSARSVTSIQARDNIAHYLLHHSL